VIEETTEGKLDFSALKEAIEGKDPDAMLAFYAEDAELRVENAALPEGKAFELKGRGQIGRYLGAICDQQMTCSVESGAVHGERGIAFVEACRYPDGGAVSVETMLEVEGGLIVRQIDLVRLDPSEETAGGGS
jgi:ketosteroid isomerase-like protein